MWSSLSQGQLSTGKSEVYRKPIQFNFNCIEHCCTLDEILWNVCCSGRPCVIINPPADLIQRTPEGRERKQLVRHWVQFVSLHANSRTQTEGCKLTVSAQEILSAQLFFFLFFLRRRLVSFITSCPFKAAEHIRETYSNLCIKKTCLQLAVSSCGGASERNENTENSL